MADLSKPRALIGLYQVEPEPSPLTKPYSLTAKYDGVAGDDSVTGFIDMVVDTGFSVEIMGSTDVLLGG